MEVKPGYKPTEIGPIPEEWNLKGLGEVASLDVGLSKPGIVFGSGCPVVTVQDLYSGATVSVAGLKRVVVTNEEIQKYRLTKDDILIGNASVKRDGIGYANRFDGAVEDVIFAKYAYRASNLRSILPLYLLHALRADFCRHWIVANSQTGTLTNLNKAAARAIPIPVPETIGEQRAIASALFDVDALLAGLDRLFAKKRDLKQAAMQQLLNGQTRLPSFQGEWKAAQLGEVCAFRTGPFGSALHKSDYISDGVPLVNPMHIVDGTIIPTRDMTVTTHAAHRLSEFLLREGDVIIGRRGDMGRCAVVRRRQHGWLCGTGSLIVRVVHDAVPEFIQRILSSRQVITAIENSSVGTTMTNLNQGVLRQLGLRLPEPSEQAAIAAVLSVMDAELTALEARRDKTRALKQGMMQELLTGRTRLV